MKKRQSELWSLGRSLDRTLTWSNETAISARVPIHRSQHQMSSRFAEGRDASAVVALDTLARTAQNVSRRSQCPRQKVLVTKEDISASRKTKTLDELLLESEQLSQERASPVSDEPDEEEETCLLLHELGKAIIDTSCGRCVIGALTLEAQQSVMGERAKEIVWQHDAPSVFFFTATGPMIEAWVSLISLVWLVVKHADQNACRSRRSSLPVGQGLQRNHVPNSHVLESECIHHLCQCQFHPLHVHNASHRRFNRLVSLWKILWRRRSK